MKMKMKKKQLLGVAGCTVPLNKQSAHEHRKNCSYRSSIPALSKHHILALEGALSILEYQTKTKEYQYVTQTNVIINNSIYGRNNFVLVLKRMRCMLSFGGDRNLTCILILISLFLQPRITPQVWGVTVLLKRKLTSGDRTGGRMWGSATGVGRITGFICHLGTSPWQRGTHKIVATKWVHDAQLPHWKHG
jgi:hypothetical protein